MLDFKALLSRDARAKREAIKVARHSYARALYELGLLRVEWLNRLFKLTIVHITDMLGTWFALVILIDDLVEERCERFV